MQGEGCRERDAGRGGGGGGEGGAFLGTKKKHKHHFLHTDVVGGDRDSPTPGGVLWSVGICRTLAGFRVRMRCFTSRWGRIWISFAPSICVVG